MPKTTVSCRIPEQTSAVLERASELEQMLRSEMIRRALNYYIRENPDHIGLFNQCQEPAQSENTYSESQRSNTDVNSIYDPMSEL